MIWFHLFYHVDTIVLIPFEYENILAYFIYGFVFIFLDVNACYFLAVVQLKFVPVASEHIVSWILERETGHCMGISLRSLRYPSVEGERNTQESWCISCGVLIYIALDCLISW